MTTGRAAVPPKPVIVGVESHHFVGAGQVCAGILGYTRGDARYGEVCNAKPAAAIHASPSALKASE